MASSLEVNFHAWICYPGSTSGKEPACQCRRCETQVQSLCWEDPLEEGMTTHYSILAWRIIWTEEPMATVHWVVKSLTQLKQLNRQACNMHIHTYIFAYRGWCFTGGSDGKESACSAGDLSSIPGSGRAPGEENEYSLQCSCLGNPMDSGAWWATIHSVVRVEQD